MIILAFFLQLLFAQPSGLSTGMPVKADYSVERISQDSLLLNFELRIARGWHVYSTNLESGGPVAAAVELDRLSGATLGVELRGVGEELSMTDPLFGMEVRYYKDKVIFVQPLRLDSSEYAVSGALIYGACNNTSCLPPQRVEFELVSQSAVSDTGSEELTPVSAVEGYDPLLWRPVVGELQEYGAAAVSRNGSLWTIFLTGLLGGLMALLTPCVWPLIPMTVSIFLKRGGSRADSIKYSLLYGVSIVVVYVGLGLLVTLVFGASALNALSTHALPNLFFFLLLVAFALSFLGFYEITLPSSWGTAISNSSRAGKGFSSIFFMALTLTIVSFSCTGPIVGFLLVDAVQGDTLLLRPMTGMLGFSLALALPFSLFALFPQWLKELPKSGSWMERVKVTLGFVELAFSLKFLSVADMAYGWGILPRDLFILLWIIMALLLGLYLLGLVRFHKSGRERAGAISKTAGCCSLIFAALLLPGLWGKPLKAVSAFAPPMNRQIFGNTLTVVEPLFTSYEEGMRYAAAVGKPVLLDFTGYGCVNCRKMEASVWTDPEIKEIMERDYVLVSLFVDDKTPLLQPLSVDEGGTKTKLRTVGDKWSLLQRYKFGANAQPFYLILSPNGELLSAPYTFDTNADHFRRFLNLNSGESR